MGESIDHERLQMLRFNAYAADTVRELERPLLDDGVPLMRMAAAAAAHEAKRMLGAQGVALEDANVVVLAGAGDNGGDGLFAAAQLAGEDARVTVVAVGRGLHDAGFAAFAHSGGRVLVLDPEAEIPGCVTGFSAGEAGERLRVAVDLVNQADLVMDAMTGIGVSGALHGIAATLTSALLDSWGIDGRAGSETIQDHPGERPLVLAVDTPSGIGVDDGTLPGPYLTADRTVMFGALKPCAMLPPAAYACGKVTLVDFGFDIDEAEPASEMMDTDLASSAILVPSVHDMKYTRGVVGLVTGSTRYPGAAVLGTNAAARSGIGMVRYLGPQRAQDLVLQALPEAVIGKGHVNAWVVGSGVPASTDTADGDDIQRETITRLLAHYALTDESGTNDDGGHAAMKDTHPDAMPPIVVDAGALDLLPARVPGNVVITPHAGELAGLLTRLDTINGPVTADQVMSAPVRYAQLAHEDTGATVVLKGAISVIAGTDPYDNDRTRILLCGRAPAWLGTAGAGDVLAGMIGALLSQSDVSGSPDDAPAVADTVAAAVYLHGLSAAIASHATQCGWRAPEIYGAGERNTGYVAGEPIIASDVIRAIPQAIAKLIG